MHLLELQNKETIEYNDYLFEKNLKFIRTMLLIGVLFYSSFGILDAVLGTIYLYAFLIIRFGIIAPLIFIVLALSYHKSFKKTHQFVLTSLYVIASLGIVVMLTLDPILHTYYGGLFLVFGFGFFLLKIKWKFVATGSFIVILSYFISSIILTPTMIKDTIVYSIFYIAFVVISVLGSFSHSRDQHQSYLHEMSMKNNKVLLERTIYENLIDLENSNRITVDAIASLAESRDIFTGDHIKRVGKLTLKLAYKIHPTIYKKNNISKEDILKHIELSSMLHDIGKISIPDDILMKPGKLNADEWEIMKRHTILGSNTLSKLKNEFPKNGFVNMGIDICQSHHENWDGSGYPEGLKETDIPFSARLVSIIDVYDALISERPYKKAYSVEKSLKEISALRGEKFDPDICDAFLSLFK